MDATTQRVTLADDDTGVISLEAIETSNAAASLLGSGVLIAKSDDENSEFTVSYTSGTTLTVSDYSPQMETMVADDIVMIAQYDSSGELVKIFYKDQDTITMVGDVITVSGSTFTATDSFVLYTNVSKMASFELESETSYVDTTNLTVADHYYPGATGEKLEEYNHLSLTGTLVCASGTITAVVQVTNGTDWIDAYGYCDSTDATAKSISASSGTTNFAWSFNKIGFKKFRIKVTPTNATNTARIEGFLKNM